MESETQGRVGEILGLSVKVIFFVTVVIVLFGIYVGVLLFGENSLTVLNHLTEQKRVLMKEASTLKSENQRLQKEYFELKQLEGGEE